MKPQIDAKGYVFIPHPEGEGGNRCHPGCGIFSDGRRHMPDCPSVLAWKEALGGGLDDAYRIGWHRGRVYALDQDGDSEDEEWSAQELEGHLAAWKADR